MSRRLTRPALDAESVEVLGNMESRLDAVVDVRLNDGSARIPKSRQGRPKVSHGFNRGLRLKNDQSPGGPAGRKKRCSANP